MQVPEKLALIGGSILLSSTLVFTLKSQASSIIPHVGSSVSHVFDHIGDAKKDSDFNEGFQDAQKQGWQTGHWGTVPFYLDNHQRLYVGSGQSQGQLKNAVGTDISLSIHSITFDGHVQTPQNSWGLLSDFTNVTTMNGLDQIDVSQANDLSWDFSDDKSLTNLDIGSWQTPHLDNGKYMFGGLDSLTNLNINSMNTSHADMSNIFNGNKPNLTRLELGSRSYLRNSVGIQGTWLNGQQKMNASDLGMAETSHAGSWYKVDQ